MKILTITLCILVNIQALAQSPRKLKQDSRFELKIDKQSLVLTPSTMDDSQKYPLVIFLPYTGGTAKDYYDTYLSHASSEQGGMGIEKLRQT